MQQEQQAHALDAFLERFHDEQSGGSPDEPEETYHVYPVPGGMVILKEDPEDQVIEAAIPPNTQPPSRFFTAATVLFALLLPLASILLQVFFALHPPLVTVTIMPRIQTVTVSGTVRMGRLIPPITLSQAATTKTSGRGHEDAKQARGFITFYNGQFTAQTVPAGTMLTGADGIQIVTDQDATIPAGNPPSYGQVSVSAHTVAAGASGNIAAYDINQPCCAAAVRAENVNTFSGGQDERNFQTVAKADIDNAASPLKTALSASINGAFHGQLTPGEKLIPLPCSPAVSPDHHVGEAAATITVTVSQTCRAVAYDTASLQNSAAAMLMTEGKRDPGAHFRLIGTVQVSVVRVGMIDQARGRASIMVHIAGVWGYQFTQTELRRIAHQIAGKPQEAARNILLHVPGIQSATIAGIAETTNIPRNTDLIHFAFG